MNDALDDLFPDLQKSPSEEERERENTNLRIKARRAELNRLRPSRQDMLENPVGSKSRIAEIEKELKKLKYFKPSSEQRQHDEVATAKKKEKIRKERNAREQRARRPRVPPRSPALAWGEMEI